MPDRHYWTLAFAAPKDYTQEEAKQFLQSAIHALMTDRNTPIPEERITRRMHHWTLPEPTEDVRAYVQKRTSICDQEGNPNPYWMTTNVRRLTLEAYDRGEPFVASTELDGLCSQFALLWLKDHGPAGPTEGHICGKEE